jgi:hypothetical protein
MEQRLNAEIAGSHDGEASWYFAVKYPSRNYVLRSSNRQRRT